MLNPTPTPRGRRGSLFKERLQLPSPTIAFIGDSIFAKFPEVGGSTWDRCFSPLNAGNMGVVGESTQMLIEKLERDMLPLEETQIVVLMIGATDLRHRIKVSVVFDQIRKIIQLLQACRPGVKVIVCGILPRGDVNLDCNDSIAETNEHLSSLENGFTVRYIALEARFFDRGGTGMIKAELFVADRINLNEKGYALLAEAIAPVLQECLQEDKK